MNNILYLMGKYEFAEIKEIIGKYDILNDGRERELYREFFLKLGEKCLENERETMKVHVLATMNEE